MTMTMAKQIEIANQKKEREMEAMADRYTREFNKEMKKERIKESLKFRANCLKGFVTGNI